MTKPTITETVPVSDVFATGVLPLESQDGVCRLTYYVERFDPASGLTLRDIVARIVLPEAVMAKAGKAKLALAG